VGMGALAHPASCLVVAIPFRLVVRLIEMFISPCPANYSSPSKPMNHADIRCCEQPFPGADNWLRTNFKFGLDWLSHCLEFRTTGNAFIPRGGWNRVLSHDRELPTAGPEAQSAGRLF
jgi:hypothetical protein